jgi:hypothetical protein
MFSSRLNKNGVKNMKRSNFTNAILLISLFVFLGANAVFPQTTEFSYQGFLTDNSASANGNFDFEFRLFDVAAGGVPLGSILRPNVTVTNGVFSVVLNFGSFPAADRFLEIAVRPPGGSVSTTLAPRSKLLSTPYSTNAINAQNALNAQNAANSTNATNAVNSQNAQNAINATNSQTAQNALQLGGVQASQFVQTNDSRLNDARNPLPNSANYIQNRTTPQTATNFNIVGDGTVSGTLTGNIVSAQQFNAGPGRVLAKVGQNNLYVGTLTGAANGGTQNTLTGDAAGQDNTGDQNAFFGFVAGQRSTTGSNNTFVGSRAGQFNSTESGNTFIGSNTGGADNFSNATAVGANAFVEQSNAIVLGSIAGVNGATAMTDVGIGITTPARRLDVNGIIRVGSITGTVGCIEDRDGTVIAGTCASDERFKKKIAPFGKVLNNFSRLRPVNYFWRADEFSDQRFGTKQSYGLIAQEVEAAFPELVSTDEKGFKAVNYSKLPLLTIQAVNELKAENDALRQQIEEQKKQSARQEHQLRKQQQQLDDLKKFVYRRPIRQPESKKGGNRQ